MRVLNFWIVLFVLGLYTNLEAANYPHTSNPIHHFAELSDNDDLSLSVVMMNKKKVFVQWKSIEQGVYFEIERSTNGENFEMIATSADVVSSSNGTVFQFIDESPSVENYYRIFYITPSGEINYSDVTYISPLPNDMTINGLK